MENYTMAEIKLQLEKMEKRREYQRLYKLKKGRDYYNQNAKKNRERKLKEVSTSSVYDTSETTDTTKSEET
jgi:hypothetical protein